MTPVSVIYGLSAHKKRPKDKLCIVVVVNSLSYIQGRNSQHVLGRLQWCSVFYDSANQIYKYSKISPKTCGVLYSGSDVDWFSLTTFTLFLPLQMSILSLIPFTYSALTLHIKFSTRSS